jgi:transcriptional regulator with XRE-family HTH domain
MNEKTLGQKVNELLAIRDMKPADLHRATGLSTGLISDICNDKRTSVTIDTLRKLAKALNIHPAYFLEDRTVGPADILPHLTDEQRRFVLDPKRSLPWLGVGLEAEKLEITAKKIQEIIKIMSE